MLISVCILTFLTFETKDKRKKVIQYIFRIISVVYYTRIRLKISVQNNVKKGKDWLQYNTLTTLTKNMINISKSGIFLLIYIRII
jgi:hypothetical protein